VKAVKRWPSSAGSDLWVVIFGNYDILKLPGHAEPDTFDIRPFFPEANHHAVLIITQSSRLQVGHPVAVVQSANMYNIDIDIDIDIDIGIDTYHVQLDKSCVMTRQWVI
jgi:hypothetical protein